MQVYQRYSEDFVKDIVNEPLFDPASERLFLYPIQYPVIWKCYKEQAAHHWTPSAIKLEGDDASWNAMSPGMQFLISTVLAFFSIADSLVNKNIESCLIQHITIMEVKISYDFQRAMENVHLETYADLLYKYVPQEQMRLAMVDCMKTMPAIGKKGQWCQKWIDSDTTFAHKLIAFAIVEGVFFSGSFAAIFWIQNQPGKVLPGLVQANEYIQRDESFHVKLAYHVYEMTKNKLKTSVVHQIMREAIEIESEFMISAIPYRMLGMNSETMIQHVQFTGDMLLAKLGYPKIYNVECPFDFMLKLGLWSKSDFFVVESTNYLEE